MTDFTLATIKANELIYDRLKNGLDDDMSKRYDIGAGGDVSAGIDLYAEEIFVQYLGKYGKIESEESGSVGSGKATIVLDPIDGSSNLLSDFPYYGSSVALIAEDGILSMAIICNLANGDIFVKESGGDLIKGKLFSDKWEKVKKVKEPEIGIFERSYYSLDIVKGLKDKNLKYRSPGAVALSLAYAHGVEFFLMLGPIRIYDIVAGLSFCEDLTVIVEDEYVIVSHKEEIAKKLENIVKGV